MSYKTIKYLLVFLMGTLIMTTNQLQAEGNKKDDGKKLNKTDAQIASTYLDINSISSFFYNNGISDIAASGNSGFVYPKGSGRTAVFTSGLLWGAKVTGFADPRVGGTAYRTGLVPGKVLADGKADDPNLDKYRIYRVRRDIYPNGPIVDLTAAGINELNSPASIRTQYEKDWTEWPADMGAPFDDKNGDGVYEADKDIPGVPGADQTLWYVTNDLSSGQTTYLYNSNPLGIECQVTIWAYNKAGALGNMYFRKYKLINVTNRSSLTPITFNDMYVSMWSDVDLGDAGDDFVGVDTVLSLQYCYNAKGTDATYTPLPPPAVGFDFFQGPLVNGVAGEDKNKNGVDDATDYGIFNGAKVGPGKINLPMTAAYYFANGDPNIGDPPQGTNGTADGYRQFYNFFQGKFGISGATFTNLVTGLPTTYALSGDPVKGTGWLDGVQLPAGDRRQGSASGPFNMAPGDTQEVVVAEIVAGATPGSDNLKAITALKIADAKAQEAYEMFFKLPDAPPAPLVSAKSLDETIVLDWGSDLSAVAATENNKNKTFTFQGYNVYQLPSASSTKEAGVRIATYDIVDDIATVLDKVIDPLSGVEVKIPAQYGTNYGVYRSITLDKDYINQNPLINGIKYYYAVTAYSYSPDETEVPNNLENPLQIITVVPHTPDPGVTYEATPNESLPIEHSAGLADGKFAAKVIDPTVTKGHDYEVFFTDRQEIRNQSGDWVAGSKVSRKFSVNHPDTLTGTTIDAAAVHGPSGAPEVELHFLLNLESADGDWADGILLSLPIGTTILSAPAFEAGNGSITPVVNGSTVVFGDTSHSFSTDGPFIGGEDLVVVVSSLTLPATINWTVFDDGYGGGPVDASGTSTVTSVGTSKRTAKYWNVKDVTTGLAVLEHQGSVVDKSDPNGYLTINNFPPRDDIRANSTTSAYPIIDGFQVGPTSGGFDAPVVLNADKTTLNEGSASSLVVGGTSASSTKIVINNYTIYGFPTSWAKDDWGYGTTEVSQLQQDYELRFTGVWDTVVVGTQTIVKIKDGTGSLATIFSGLNSNSIKNHPLNPNPGTTAPFLVRIPFEVWNKDTKKQVNLMFRDREQTATASPFYAWNPKNRMYSIIVNSDYNATTPLTGTLRDSATWTVVFYGTNYHVGDVLTLSYDNPFVSGGDKYIFSTKGSSYSKSLAETQIDKINVFPNPYYGVNSEELNKYNRFVTFSHLPTKATIRIFNLAGVNVKTIEKVATGQFQRWDLANEAGLPVASGLYIVYIDLPELGKTKILKVAVIQEKQILDRF